METQCLGAPAPEPSGQSSFPLCLWEKEACLWVEEKNTLGLQTVAWLCRENKSLWNVHDFMKLKVKQINRQKPLKTDEDNQLPI